MQARDFAKVSLKVMGIYWLVVAVHMLPTVLAMLRISKATESGVPVPPLTLFFTQLGLFSALVAIGLALLLGTKHVLRFFFSEPAYAGAPLDSLNLQSVAFSLLGAWLLVSALADLASSSVLHFVFSGIESEAQHEHHTREFWEVVIQSAFLIVVGSWLFFRARGISAAWHKRA